MSDTGASPVEGKPAFRAVQARPGSQLAVLLALCVIFFWRVLFSASAKIIAGYDILVYHYYARAFTRESMLRGLLPKWNPYEYAGMPFAADPGNCVFYPLNKFFLLMPVSKAISLNMALHVFLAGAGTLLFARAIGLKRGGSLIAAIAFMFSGYYIDRIAAGHEILVMCSAYLPWIFLCYELSSQSGKVGWSLLGGLFVGLQVLTGASQPVLYTAIFVFIYAVAKNIQMNPGSRFTLLGRDLGYLVLMGGVGIGLSAVQLLPSVELVLHSVRAQTSIEFVGSYSFPPRNFIHFLLPYLDVGKAIANWEFSCYVGILPLALALAMLPSLKGRRARALGAVGLVAVLIMLGRHTPVFPALMRIIPGLKLFRIHARAEVGLILVLALWAGMGWEKIFNNPLDATVKIRRNLAVAAGLFAAAVCVVAVLFLLKKTALSFQTPSPSHVFGFLVDKGGPVTSLWHPRIFLPMSAVFITFVAALLLLRRCDTGMKRLLAGLIIVDLLVMSTGRIRLVDTSYVSGNDELVESVERDEGAEYFRVWFPLKVFFGSRAKFFGIFDVNGHNALGLTLFEDYLESLSGISPVRTLPYYEMDRRLFERERIFVDNILNVKYFSVEREGNEPVFYRADSFFPRALFVSDYVIGSPRDFFTSGIDPETTVFLHEKPPPGYHPGESENAANARVKIDSYRNDEIDLSVDAPADGFLVLSEVYYPGWRAEVDGAATKVLRGDFLLRVVPVRSGKHKVRLFFAPLSLLLGKLISAATIAAVVCALLYLRVRSRRIAAAGAPASDDHIDSADPDTQG